MARGEWKVDHCDGGFFVEMWSSERENQLIEWRDDREGRVYGPLPIPFLFTNRRLPAFVKLRLSPPSPQRTPCHLSSKFQRLHSMLHPHPPQLRTERELKKSRRFLSNGKEAEPKPCLSVSGRKISSILMLTLPNSPVRSISFQDPSTLVLELFIPLRGNPTSWSLGPPKDSNPHASSVLHSFESQIFS